VRTGAVGRGVRVVFISLFPPAEGRGRP